MNVRKPFKIPTSPHWYVDVVVDGKTKRRSLRTTDYTEAMQDYSKIVRSMLDSGIKRGIHLSSFREDIRAWSTAIHRPATVRARVLAINKLMRQFGDIRLTDLTPRHADVFISAEIKDGRKPGAVNSYLRDIKAVLTKAVDWKYITEPHPFAKVKLIRIMDEPPKYLEPCAVEELLAATEDMELRLIITAYFATGRRRAELLSLDWKDIDLKNRRYTIHATNSKTRKERRFPISELFLTVLESVGPKESGLVFPHWLPNTVSKKVKGILRATGHGDLHLHNLRHSFGSGYIASGGSIRVLMDLLGHQQITTTMRYNFLLDDTLSAEVDRVSFRKESVK